MDTTQVKAAGQSEGPPPAPQKADIELLTTANNPRRS